MSRGQRNEQPTGGFAGPVWPSSPQPVACSSVKGSACVREPWAPAYGTSAGQARRAPFAVAPPRGRSGQGAAESVHESGRSRRSTSFGLGASDRTPEPASSDPPAPGVPWVPAQSRPRARTPCASAGLGPNRTATVPRCCAPNGCPIAPAGRSHTGGVWREPDRGERAQRVRVLCHGASGGAEVLRGARTAAGSRTRPL